jgi:hypothetical protein
MIETQQFFKIPLPNLGEGRVRVPYLFADAVLYRLLNKFFKPENIFIVFTPSPQSSPPPGEALLRFYTPLIMPVATQLRGGEEVFINQGVKPR